MFAQVGEAGVELGQADVEILDLPPITFDNIVYNIERSLCTDPYCVHL